MDVSKSWYWSKCSSFDVGGTKQHIMINHVSGGPPGITGATTVKAAAAAVLAFAATQF